MSDANLDRRLGALESRFDHLERLLAAIHDKLDRAVPNARDVVAARSPVVVDAFRPERRVSESRDFTASRDRRAIRFVRGYRGRECGKCDERRERNFASKIASETKACVGLQRAKRRHRIASLGGEDRLRPNVRRLNRPRLRCARHLVSGDGNVVRRERLRGAAPRRASHGGRVDGGESGHLLCAGK